MEIQTGYSKLNFYPDIMPKIRINGGNVINFGSFLVWSSTSPEPLDVAQRKAHHLIAYIMEMHTGYSNFYFYPGITSIGDKIAVILSLFLQYGQHGYQTIRFSIQESDIKYRIRSATWDTVTKNCSQSAHFGQPWQDMACSISFESPWTAET